MNFSELKPIFDTKTFNILASLTNNPRCDLYLPDFTSLDEYDPFDETSADSSTITQGENVFIENVRCIYTYNKMIVQETDVQLGSTYTLIIYIRSDDLPIEIKQNLSSTIIKFNDVFYTVSSHLNLYDILYEFNLK